MEQRFAGKVAVVTGGVSGIGVEIVRLLAGGGARVVVGDLHAEAGQALVDELGAERLAFLRCDVADSSQVQALVALADARFGGLDLLFNNAGVGSPLADTPEQTEEAWLKVIAVDLHAVFYGCKHAIPLMRRRGGGAIVNTASISGLAGDYGFSAYSAAKGAVINYTRTLALDHAHENIRVNALCPGLVETPLTAGVKAMGLDRQWARGIPMQRAARPLEIARTAVFLASEDASYMTGSVLVADGGVMAATGQPNLHQRIAQQRSA